MDESIQDVNLAKMKERRRRELISSRKKKRDVTVKSKRFRAELVEEEIFSIESVKEASKAFQKKKGENTVTHLKHLRNAFAESNKYIDAFLEVENSMYSLIGFLTGKNASLQLEAICCLTNISASENKNIHTIVKSTSAYLITFLRSGSVLLQDQSAWALANMAADNEKTRELLKAQGVIEPLVDLIKSEVDEVVQSSFFALCNLCKSPTLFVSDLIKKHSLISKILLKLKTPTSSVTTVGEIMWLLSTITYTSSSTLEMLEVADVNGSCLVNALMTWASKVTPSQAEYLFVILPIVRCIGNIFGCVDIEQDKNLQLDQSSVITFLGAINTILATSQIRDFVTKECIWSLSNLFPGLVCCLDVLGIDGNIIKTNDIISKEINKLVSNVSMYLNSFSKDIKKQAGIFICNVLYHIVGKQDIINKKNNHRSRSDMIQCCLSENVFQSFASSFLNSEDDEMVWIGLNFIRVRLSFKLKPDLQSRVLGGDFESAGQSGSLYWTESCDAIIHGVIEYLQVLRHHGNDNVREKVFELLEDVS